MQSNELGPTTNVNFGKVIASTNTQDPATLNGFGARGSTIEWQAVVQHELFPRVALTGDYYFRYNGNQLVTDNTLVTSADFDGPFCITAPSSPDLPDGGGYQVCGLYDVKPTSRSLQQNNMTFARNFGGIVDHYMGYDMTHVGAACQRLARSGRDECAAPRVRHLQRADRFRATTTNQVDNPEAQFCHQVLPYRPDFKMLASYNLPLGLTASGTYQISSGPMITATWAAPNSFIAPALWAQPRGRRRRRRRVIQLIDPGTLYAGYQNQLDSACPNA